MSIVLFIKMFRFFIVCRKGRSFSCRSIVFPVISVTNTKIKFFSDRVFLGFICESVTYEEYALSQVGKFIYKRILVDRYHVAAAVPSVTASAGPALSDSRPQLLESSSWTSQT